MGRATASRIEVLELANLGHLSAAVKLCRTEFAAGGDGKQWLTDMIVKAMERADLTLAGSLAAIYATLERSSEWSPHWSGGPVKAVTGARLSLPKLRHDLAQFRHLRREGVLSPAFDKVIADYEATITRYVGLDDSTRISIDAEGPSIHRTFGRLVHVADAPRVEIALSDRWSRREAQHQYRQGSPGIVVVDNFLSESALESLFQFCLNSTVWTQNSYDHGRLGALFFNGFNCPLLLQIAEEIREAFPDLIGRAHPLRQLWGFKNTGELPADSTIHADFAAINVNFWLTPDSANLDPENGGMVIYDLEAPMSWDFTRFNQRTDLIRDFIREHQPRAIRIPYRRNRAIIFNSDLFHATEEVRFRPDYSSHRINVTMLYGDRQFDAHHREPLPTARAVAPAIPGWRSAAFRRSRC